MQILNNYTKYRNVSLLDQSLFEEELTQLEPSKSPGLGGLSSQHYNTFTICLTTLLLKALYSLQPTAL